MHKLNCKIHSKKSQFITRVGGGDPVPLNARVITATSKSIEDAIKEEKFRGDLYFQLNVLPVLVQPLRDHFEDVPELLEYYVNYFVSEERLPLSPLLNLGKKTV